MYSNTLEGRIGASNNIEREEKLYDDAKCDVHRMPRNDIKM
jgi:hypothetical protein